MLCNGIDSYISVIQLCSYLRLLTSVSSLSGFDTYISHAFLSNKLRDSFNKVSLIFSELSLCFYQFLVLYK